MSVLSVARPRPSPVSASEPKAASPPLRNSPDTPSIKTHSPSPYPASLQSGGPPKFLLLDFMAKQRLPGITDAATFVRAGALMAYGPGNEDHWRRVATYVDTILKGAKPADLPIEQPTKFELIINLRTAKALGLTIPRTILIRADEVIQ